jgi:hypothetical protein
MRGISMSDNEWSSYEKFVIEKLSEHGTMLAKVQDKLVEMQLEVNSLKIKFTLATAIGITLASVVPPITAWAIKIIKVMVSNPKLFSSIDSIIKLIA